MANSCFVVCLKQNKLIIVDEKWIQNKSLGAETKVFHSPNAEEEPDFNVYTQFYFDGTFKAVYDCRVVKFGNV